MVSLKRSVRRLSTAVCITAISLSGLAGAEETTAYEMISYLDHSSGRKLTASHLEAAIESASIGVRSRNSENALAATTNLCIALTMKKNLSEAREACERALTLAREVDDKGSYRASRSYSETVKAITNRGVVRALGGDIPGAEEDFREAAKMRREFNAPVHNLAYLERSAAYRLAMARTTP